MHHWKKQCQVKVHVKRKSKVLKHLRFSTPVYTLKCIELDLASDRRISRWLRITERLCFPVQLICGLPAFLDIDLTTNSFILLFTKNNALNLSTASPEEVPKVFYMTGNTFHWDQLSPDLAEVWIMMADCCVDCRDLDLLPNVESSGSS